MARRAAKCMPMSGTDPPVCSNERSNWRRARSRFGRRKLKVTDHGMTGRKIIHCWADDLESQPVQVQDRLIGQVYPALETEVLYRLRDLRATAEHDWAWGRRSSRVS